jgi:hypothetical protein
MKNASKILVGKPKGNRPLARPSSRWDSDRTDIREIRWEILDWMHLGSG